MENDCFFLLIQKRVVLEGDYFLVVMLNVAKHLDDGRD